jgi:hypothetical protein
MNDVLELANAYLESTNTIVFLTGKAGTGKTTFLQHLRQNSKKKLAVAAPTGVAAINAGGMTLHSLFQMPFGPLVPGGDSRPELKYNPEKKDLLAKLELLIIDEISMVRPDVLDQVDLILRNVKGSSHPFGGVQLLLIGDLAQLSPIIRDEDWAILRPYYASPYFFSSRVLQKAPFVRIELEHVYRQKDEDFVAILNEVRDQKISEQSLALLNSSYIPGFKSLDEPYITLTTHNNRAREINQEFIDALQGEATEFTATIKGDFPKDGYPTETTLKLKAGAQVMFVKNDSSAEKLFYNGKIGKVIKIAADSVVVECGSGQEIAVKALEWNNQKYELDGEQISETNAGSFAQLPLKLAWAITIHKSQGLTFDRAIIDVSAAFTHGQAYVALSRCRNLAGMVLREPMSAANLIGDPAVSRFNEQARSLRPDQDTLKNDIERYHQFLLTDLFNFNPLKDKAAGFEALLPGLEGSVHAVSAKFIKKITPEKVKDAAVYFHQKLKEVVEGLHAQLPDLIGKSKVRAGQADALLNWLMNKIRLMEYFSQNQFQAEAYLSLNKQKGASTASYLEKLNARPNEQLRRDLIDWRERKAAEQKVMPNMVFSEQTLATVAEKVPATLKALSAIKGIGPQKANLYGPELITLIRSYQQAASGVPEQPSLF